MYHVLWEYEIGGGLIIHRLSLLILSSDTVNLTHIDIYSVLILDVSFFSVFRLVIRNSNINKFSFQSVSWYYEKSFNSCFYHDHSVNCVRRLCSINCSHCSCFVFVMEWKCHESNRHCFGSDSGKKLEITFDKV